MDFEYFSLFSLLEFIVFTIFKSLEKSQLAFVFLFLGLIPGIYCDMCRKFLNKNGSQKGDAFGLATSFIMGAAMLSASSFLQAQQDKDLAFA